MEFKVGNYYSFSTYAPAILGQDYKKLRLMAVGDYSTASMFENVDVVLNNILAYLGPQANDDASKDQYLIFKTESGSIKVFGTTWINMTTVETAVSQIVTVTVEGASLTDATRIREILAAAGYNKVTTKVSGVAGS